ncbi:MAG: peptidoglycan-binding domain-containing protein [Chthoniobacterales bacterium]
MRNFRAGSLVLVAWLAVSTAASAGYPFVYRDGLAPRDEWGKLHQSRTVLPTDFEPRPSVRFHYYFKGARTLQNDPAYVAALQTALQRLGYSCGEIDGVYGDETSSAIARLQKNHGMRVTGNLSVAVRRVLYLP